MTRCHTMNTIRKQMDTFYCCSSPLVIHRIAHCRSNRLLQFGHHVLLNVNSFVNSPDVRSKVTITIVYVRICCSHLRRSMTTNKWIENQLYFVGWVYHGWFNQSHENLVFLRERSILISKYSICSMNQSDYDVCRWILWIYIYILKRFNQMAMGLQHPRGINPTMIYAFFPCVSMNRFFTTVIQSYSYVIPTVQHCPTCPIFYCWIHIVQCAMYSVHSRIDHSLWAI